MALCEHHGGIGLSDVRSVLLNLGEDGPTAITFVSMIFRRLLPIATFLVVVFLPADVWAQGCSMCKAVAETQPGGNVYGGSQAVGAGLNKGILFMMTVPYILLFLFFRKRIVGFIKEFRSAQG